MGTQQADPGIRNALSIDVEDWFQVSAFAPVIARADWERLPCRVERNVERLLELLAENQAQATFFTLGWIAERYPQLVRRIVGAGHELASHGYGHLRASEQTREQFRADIRRARALLQDIGQVAVDGYRAPSFSIGAGNLWAFDELAAAGHRYSSSVYPVAHDHYGMPEAPRFAWRRDSGLLEIPVSTARIAGRNWPVGGGGYFRLAPYALSRWAIRHVNLSDRRPAIFYMHPWEIDPGQPRVRDASIKAKFRHYLNLGRTESRQTRLLSDFRWARVDQAWASELA